MIGKEEYYQSKETPDTESFYNEILSQREKINSENNNSWSSNIDDQFQPEWNNNLDRVFLNSNALTKYWGQKNILNRQLKNRSEEHTSELQSRPHLVCRLLLEKKKQKKK